MKVGLKWKDENDEVMVGEILQYFCRMALGGPVIGCLFGYLAFLTMKAASDKHRHSDTTIQTAVTVMTAYLSFFVAEAETTMSGVLSCVFAALYLAKYGWPVVNHHESLKNVWHALEYVEGGGLGGLLASRRSHRIACRSHQPPPPPRARAHLKK